MAQHVVADLIFDEHNEREMARHGIVRYDVDEIVWNRQSSPRTRAARLAACC